MTELREPVGPPTEQVADAPQRRSPLRRIGAVVVAVLLVVGVGVGAFVLRPSGGPDGQLTAQERAAMRAAGTAVVDLISYRRSSFDADYRRGLARTTGKLHGDMLTAERQTRQTMTAGRFDLAAKLDATALVPAPDRDGTDVLVVVSGWTVSNSGAQSSPKIERVQMTMKDVDGRWLATNLQVPDGAWRATSSADERAQVMNASTRCIAAMNTYDFNALAAAKRRALACTTGAFTHRYATSFDQVTTAAARSKTSQTFQVTGAGLQQLTGDTARVLVFGQVETRTGKASPQYGLLSTEVTMSKVGDTWKVTGYRTTP